MKFIDEDCPGIVPLKRLVQKENVEYNGSCRVRWSNGKIYQAFLICSGVKFVCIFSLIVCILCLYNAITLQLIGTMEECRMKLMGLIRNMIKSQFLRSKSRFAF